MVESTIRERILQLKLDKEIQEKKHYQEQVLALEKLISEYEEKLGLQENGGEE